MPAKPLKPVKAFKHKGVSRAHIPSAEEAGYEDGSDKVAAESTPRDFPRNPVVHRGQDPELFWLNKYGPDDAQDRTAVDIRSLYRTEHIAPETLIKNLYRYHATEDAAGPDLPGFATPELFGNAIGHEELDKVSDYYTHSDGWTNRLIQGDSLLVMTSLLEREGMAGQVQCCYIDPPYGIKYGSNWQIHLHNRTVKDGDDDALTGEPEQIKAFRDTWELGIHSYLTYLRDRLLTARELLHESGSCFVQISDENVHLVRCLMDEVFGSANFVAEIVFVKTSAQEAKDVPKVCDFVVFYAKDKEQLKFRKLWLPKDMRDAGVSDYDRIEMPDGSRRRMTSEEVSDWSKLPSGARPYTQDNIVSQRPPGDFPVEFEGEIFRPITGYWKTGIEGMKQLVKAKRVERRGRMLRYVRFFDDFPFRPIANFWSDVRFSSRSEEKVYVVQTAQRVVERCILMTTDPGDLVLDPTCGSGTTANVAEQWGRRWITTDTSRIALNIAKTRLMTATYPYYLLHDQETCEVRQGFSYKTVPHVGLKCIANNEPPETETLYDQPQTDKQRLRVAGPFTVETLQSYEPISPEELARQRQADGGLAAFEDLIFEHLKSAGIKTGDKREQAIFTRIDRLSHSALHAEGYYGTADGEKKAYLHIGPKFGTVSKQAVTEAIKACRDRRDADWLVILGFAFEPGLHDIRKDFGTYQVSVVRMHDDLLQQGLLKKDKKAASFVTIGEPDIRLTTELRDGPITAGREAWGQWANVSIAGLDIYDPIRDEVKSRDVHDIAYWMLDDRYDGSNFIVRQAFFCGGARDEFEDWRKGLSNLAKINTKKKAAQTLRLEIDEEAFDTLYGHESRPFPVEPGQHIAVRVISQFGEETTRILTVA